MTHYRVVVRNELTGDRKVVPVEADCAATARVEALWHQFRHAGWRKATAGLTREARGKTVAGEAQRIAGKDER